jgi:hypothetical protein
MSSPTEAPVDDEITEWNPGCSDDEIGSTEDYHPDDHPDDCLGTCDHCGFWWCPYAFDVATCDCRQGQAHWPT